MGYRFLKFFMCATLLFQVQQASAQILMEQSRVELDVLPGQTVVDRITLHNRANYGVNVRVYWQDFNYLPPYTGSKEFLPGGTSKYSMSDWVTFSPREVLIRPQSKTDIDYTIKVPENATGGHYGVLFFEQGEEKTLDSTGVNIITRLGALFFVDSVNRDKTITASSLTIKDNVFTGTMKNKGDVYLFPMGQYYLIDNDGLVTDRGKLKKIYLPPEAEATYDFELEGLSAGEHTMVLTFNLGDGDSLTREVDIKKGQNGRIEVIAQRN